MKVLETQRLRLPHIQQSDFNELLRMNSDPIIMQNGFKARYGENRHAVH
jgi:RimJ/RimL family protein N-acetyltransferase